MSLGGSAEYMGSSITKTLDSFTAVHSAAKIRMWSFCGRVMPFARDGQVRFHSSIATPSSPKFGDNLLAPGAPTRMVP